MHKIILAFGGNRGDVPVVFEQALLWLKDSGAVSNVTTASLYTSRSLLKDNQNDYINTVCTGLTELKPLELLSKIKETEKHFGRTEHGFWQARPLDIDIIDYDGESIEAGGLLIPHPRMTERGFVLLPLQELVPTYIHPLSEKNIDTLIAELADDQNTQKWK